MKRKISLLLTSIIIVGLLAGCGGGKTSSYKADSAREYDEYATDDVYETTMAEEYDAEMPMNGSDAGSVEGVENEAVAKSSRKIIKNVHLSAETEEFDELISTINAKVNQLGGYMESTDISGRSINSSKAQKRSASLVARIPAENLDKFVTTVTENSNIINKSESAEDVTLSYADTEARIKSLRTEQDRLNELLSQAIDLDTIIVIEERLAEVRYEIESYESRLRTMDNMVEYSTVYLNISEVERYTVVEEPEQTVGQRMAQGFSENLVEAGEILVDFFVGFVVSIPKIFVVLLFIAIPTVIIIALVKFIIGLAKGPEYKKAKRASKAEKKAAKKAAKNAKHMAAPIQPNMQEYVAYPVAPEQVDNQTHTMPLEQETPISYVSEQLKEDDNNQNVYVAQAQFMEQVNMASAEYDAVVPVNEYEASMISDDK